MKPIPVPTEWTPSKLAQGQLRWQVVSPDGVALGLYATEADAQDKVDRGVYAEGTPGVIVSGESACLFTALADNLRETDQGAFELLTVIAGGRARVY